MQTVVQSNSDPEFLALVRAVRPDLLEPSLVSDCDKDGNPSCDGEECSPTIDAQAVTQETRDSFVNVVGMGLAERATVEQPAIAPVMALLTKTVSDDSAAFLEEHQQGQARHFAASKPAGVIPRLNLPT